LPGTGSENKFRQARKKESPKKNQMRKETRSAGVAFGSKGAVNQHSIGSAFREKNVGDRPRGGAGDKGFGRLTRRKADVLGGAVS